VWVVIKVNTDSPPSVNNDFCVKIPLIPFFLQMLKAINEFINRGKVIAIEEIIPGATGSSNLFSFSVKILGFIMFSFFKAYNPIGVFK